MLYDAPINCICGQKPELKIRPIWGEGGVDYVYYICEPCQIFTFATKNEECCRELWSAMIERKIKK